MLYVNINLTGQDVLKMHSYYSKHLGAAEIGCCILYPYGCNVAQILTEMHCSTSSLLPCGVTCRA